MVGVLQEMEAKGTLESELFVANSSLHHLCQLCVSKQTSPSLGIPADPCVRWREHVRQGFLEVRKMITGRDVPGNK